MTEDGNPGAMSGKEHDTDARPSEDRGSLDVQSDLATDDGATSGTGPLTQDVTPFTPVTAATQGEKSDRWPGRPGTRGGPQADAGGLAAPAQLGACCFL